MNDDQAKSYHDPMPSLSILMFEQMKLALSVVIPEHQLRELPQYRATSWFNHKVNALVLEVHRALYGCEVHEQELKVESVPADWWQHFKLRWFPRWAVRRWPVQARRIVTIIKHCHVCPHQDVPPDAREHALFLLDRED